MSNRQEYIAEVKKLVPGEHHPIGEPEIIKAVQKAVNTHSKHRPRIVPEEVTGDGGFDYDLEDLAAWVDDFSVMRQVEYPVDDDDPDAEILEDDDWEIFAKSTGKCLRFLAYTPETTEQFRVTYTARHTCTDAACTVAESDDEAVQSLAASYFCQMLATAYATDEDSEIGADKVDDLSKSARYGRMMRVYRAEYNDHMGIKDSKPKPASMNQDQDVTYPTGHDRLTHPRRRR
jgi:hypothetical protein